jgi:hypothetical protein
MKNAIHIRGNVPILFSLGRIMAMFIPMVVPIFSTCRLRFRWCKDKSRRWESIPDGGTPQPRSGRLYERRSKPSTEVGSTLCTSFETLNRGRFGFIHAVQNPQPRSVRLYTRRSKSSTEVGSTLYTPFRPLSIINYQLSIGLFTIFYTLISNIYTLISIL